MEFSDRRMKAYEDLSSKRSEAILGGGKKRQEGQHQKGKMTARERVLYLLDKNTFMEFDAFVTHDCHHFGMETQLTLGDGVITGQGKIGGRTVMFFSQDFTVMGGSLSLANARKICKVMDLAEKLGVPLIGLNDSGGARIQEGVSSLGGYAEIFYRNVQASGVIPQLSLIMGPCAGGAVYSPAMTDFIFMVDHTSHMFITGPDVIKTVTGEEVTFDELGGSEAHAQISGVCDLRMPSEIAALDCLKKFLDYIPSNNLDPAPSRESPEESGDLSVLDDLARRSLELRDVVPCNPNLPYHMNEVIERIVDPSSFLEIKKEYACNMIIGFARLGGISVGIVGNNPSFLAGVLDINGSIKAARFVRFCDAFNIPILTFVDVPGFLPGVDQEKGGIIRHGAKLLYAFCEASVPKLTLITRKAYGGAYDVMNSKHIGADLNLAWPDAEIAVMGAGGACNIIFRKEIQSSQNTEQTRSELVDNYAAKFATPYEAASKGYIDAVIFPEESRAYLLNGLKMSLNKRQARPKRKHGNIPL